MNGSSEKRSEVVEIMLLSLPSVAFGGKISVDLIMV